MGKAERLSAFTGHACIFHRLSTSNGIGNVLEKLLEVDLKLVIGCWLLCAMTVPVEGVLPSSLPGAARPFLLFVAEPS